MGAAVSNTIMGVSIVFFVLIFLSFLISLFRFIPILEEKLTKKKIEEVIEEEKIQEVTSVVEEETELVDDLELVAVITAAIAAAQGGDPSQYIVRSIKKVRRNQW